MSDTTKANIKTLFVLTLVHFTGDFYSSFISPLYPLFVQKMALSLTQVGIVSGVIRLLAFIVQPSVGKLRAGLEPSMGLQHLKEGLDPLHDTCVGIDSFIRVIPIQDQGREPKLFLYDIYGII
jgi:hypothetical protein